MRDLKDRVVAHRGFPARCRENSTDAVRAALEAGCRFVEVDAQVSADGHPVLSHDDRLERVFGQAGRVTELPLRELVKRGVEPLHRAVALCEQAGATLFVEIKRDSFGKFGAAAVASIVSNAAGYVFISFSLEAVLIARQRFNERIGWVVPDLSEHTQAICKEVAPEFLFCDQKLIGPGTRLWPGTWVAYEVSSRRRAEELEAAGVSLFETMDVRRLQC